MKRGQITVFMILGLVLLFVFIFLFQLTSLVKTEELQQAQEEAFGKIFKKEALRIFVEDCLQDELEEGLKLIGKQGRLWKEQGGVVDFVPDVTGVKMDDGVRVYYGITRTNYQPPEKYPCDPATPVCTYAYPRGSVHFGELQLTLEAIREDLRRYVEMSARQCVESYIQEELSQEVTLEPTDLDVGLLLSYDGVSVDVTYPLKFSVAGKEFFHLTRFDFLYPTQFRKFVESAITYPLQWDYQFVDFEYNDEQLRDLQFTYGRENNPSGYCNPFLNYFGCDLRTRSPTYISFAPRLTIIPKDDYDIFEFKAPTVLRSREEYVYRIARQNRPPALDYIHREECLGNDDSAKDYDYLVVKDGTTEHPELGTIDITAFALDPDEDVVSYNWVSTPPLNNIGSPPPIREYLPGKSAPVSTFRTEVSSLLSGIQTVTVTASDDQQSDVQDVRILVDHPITTSIALQSYYGSFPIERGTEQYWVSPEDPVCLKATFPQESLDGVAAEGEIQLVYANAEGTTITTFNTPLAESVFLRGEYSYGLPYLATVATCDSNELNEYDIKEITTTSSSEIHPFLNREYITTLDGPPNTLTSSYSINYCASGNDQNDEEITSGDGVDIYVTECLPVRNPKHPWAYPYENYKYSTREENGRTVTNDFLEILEEGNKINPFLATHSCCTAEGTIKGEDEAPCFVNPNPGCDRDGGLKDNSGQPLITNSNNKYVLLEQIRQCDGQRGNTCEGSFNNKLYGDILWCGGGESGCSNVEEGCKRQFAYSYAKDDDGNNIGWCSGSFGCDKVCQKGIGFRGSNPRSFFSTNTFYFDGESINALATEATLLFGESNLETSNLKEQFPFQCGCTGLADGTPCDGDYDGYFNEVCSSGDCNAI